MNSPVESAGIAHLWTQGDFVSRTVALVLLVMSLTTWIIILWKGLDQRTQRRQAKACESFWHSADFAEGIDKLGKDDGNPFRALALEGREATRHILHKDGQSRPQLHDSLDMSDWVERSLRNSLDDFTARAQSGLTVLASIASTAPFVGLFGTVWAIYSALVKIGASGQASIDRVAGPVGEALIMTAIGLAVAVPAVFGYNWLLRKNKLALENMRNFGSKLAASESWPI